MGEINGNPDFTSDSGWADKLVEGALRLPRECVLASPSMGVINGSARVCARVLITLLDVAALCRAPLFNVRGLGDQIKNKYRSNISYDLIQYIYL